MKRLFFLTGIFLLLLSKKSLFPNVIINERLPELNTNLNYPDGNKSSKEELVLQYLKNIQDNFSQNHWLVPAMEDNSGQTFNNALTAMAFILSGERERAERILDFYASRTDSANQIINKQNCFYNYQARGFYQNVDLNNSYYPFICDRWMGDNVWLLFAYKFYEKEYGFGSKPLYEQVTTYLKNLLLEFYIDDPYGHGGFVRHGWRWGPRNSSNPQNDYQLHEFDQQGNPIGHEEGNIDAYAAFKLCGEDEKAAKVKEWINYRMTQLGNSGLPLDLFSWRALAFCNEGLYYKLLVNVPENDPGFKKVVTFNGKQAVGFFSRDDISINNVWLDGTGHMVCAFYSSGFYDKGNFYSAQLDSFLINRAIGGTSSLALPFTANKTGGYDWVDIEKGFSSACAWYIFAKHGFNPFTFDKNLPTDIEEDEQIKLNYNLEQNYPNPFNPSTKISWRTPVGSWQMLKVFDVLGNEVATLIDEYKPAGMYNLQFTMNNLSSGIYFYQFKAGDFVESKKMILIK
jgi:hypothetical protein